MIYIKIQVGNTQREAAQGEPASINLLVLSVTKHLSVPRPTKCTF